MHKINKKILILLFLVTLIGGFLRFYKLDKYPVQLNHDEISQIYDTASIVQTGKDIYGNFLPLAFPSTGEFKVGHYIYISILSYLIFGMREITIRIPAAFFGTLIIPAVFLFINQLTKNWKLALLAAASIAITPSEIFYSRKSFENVIGIFFVFVALFFLLRLIEEKRKLFIFLTALFLALPMYIYTSHTIVVPLILIVFAGLFWGEIKIQPKKFISLVVSWLILILPLIFITITNEGLRFRAATVSIFQDAGFAQQLHYLGVNNPVISAIFGLKTLLEYSFTKYLNQFDIGFIFGKGLDLTNQGMIGLGPLMLLQLPFFLLGFVYIVKSNFFLKRGIFLFVLLFLAMIPSGITFESLSPHRSVLAFSLISIISSFGFYFLYIMLQKLSSSTIKISITSFLVLLFLLNSLYAVHMYTSNFPNEKSQGMHYPYKDVALFAWSQYGNYEHIIIDPMYGQTAPVRAVAVHYYLAYYGNYSPEKFQKDLKIKKEEISIDKFSIREVDWRKDHEAKNTLIITSSWSLPESVIKEKEILKTFNFYDGSIAFYAIKL